MSIVPDEIKHLKDQVKSLETQLKVYENHLYILQNDLQYTQKNLQLEQAKQQNQITSLASLVLDVVKENRQYEEHRENNVLQRINNIINLDINDYSGLNSLSAGGSGVTAATNALGNEASLINGITLNSSTQASNASGATTNANALLNPRISSAEQLLTPSSLQAPTQSQQLQPQQTQTQSHSQTQSQHAQMNPLQQSQIAAIQQSFQQQQQHHRHQRNLHLQSQNSNLHHYQQSQPSQRQPSQSQSQSQQQQQVQQQTQQQHASQAHKQSKKRKTPSQDPASILDDPLNYTTATSGQQKSSMSSSRHVPIAMNGTMQPSSASRSSLNPADTSLSQDESEISKRRKVYDKEYSFIKAPNSVEEVWNEYSVGLNGQPSIKSLELEYKTGWRRDPATSKKFNRRKAIYHAIEKGLSKGYSVDYCIELLEDFRYLDREKNTKQPIGWLCHGNLPAELK